MNKLKRIGKGILGGAVLTVGAAAGFGLGALQLIAEEAIVQAIDNIF